MPHNPNDNWSDNKIQFARLLAEIRAVGLTPEQYRDLTRSMGLYRFNINEILERAEKEWENIKILLDR